MAGKLLAEGNVDKAISICKKGLEVYPHYEEAKLILGEAYLTKGMLAEAKGNLKEVLELDQENLRALQGLMEIAQREGDVDEATQLAELILQIDPSHRKATSFLQEYERKQAPQEVEAEEGPLIEPVEPPEEETTVGGEKPTLGGDEAALEPPPEEVAEEEVKEQETAEPEEIPSIEEPQPPEEIPPEPPIPEEKAEEEPSIEEPTAEKEETPTGEGVESPPPEKVAENPPPEISLPPEGGPPGLDEKVPPHPTEEKGKPPRTREELSALGLEEGIERLENEFAGIETPTLAEIYRKQGLWEKALEVYARLLEREPENEEYRIKIEEIKKEMNEDKGEG